MSALKLALKSLFYQGNLNHENMQGAGFSYLISEAAKTKGIVLDEDTLRRETEYFHTHPYLANFILGMWVKEHKLDGQPDFYKKVYASAFGALGDSFFWHSLRPFCFLIAAMIGFADPFYGIVTYLVLYNIFHLSFRFSGFTIGYNMGKDVIVFFNRIGMNRWAGHMDLGSAFMLGLLLSFFVKHCSDFGPLIIGVLTVYLLLGLAFARKLDIIISMVIMLIMTGFFIHLAGV